MVVEEIIRRINWPYAGSDEIIKNWRDIKKKLKIGAVIMTGLVGIYSSVYTIAADSNGVLKRFGKHITTTEPGIHLKIPYGIDKIIEVPVKKVQKVEFGFRTLKAGIDSSYLGSDNLDKANVSDLENLVKEVGLTPETDLIAQAKNIIKEEYLMLTGDLNMANIECIIQYKIKDPAAYLFNIRSPVQTIRDATQAVMKRIIGDGSVDEAITIGRVENEISAGTQLQGILDDYSSGIHIVTAKLQSCNPPKRVRPAFNGVNEAMQEKEQKINEAMQQYNKEIPEARGKAKRTIEQAQGYATERINKAQGDANKFLEVYTKYKDAPEITKQRLYLETMAKVLPSISDKIIVDNEGLRAGFYRQLGLNMYQGEIIPQEVKK